MPKRLILLLILFTSIARAEDLHKPQIVEIRKADHVVVNSGEAKEGDSIDYGSIVHAPQGGSVWISYPNQSLLQVEERGTIRIPKPEGTRQVTDLIAGRVRVLVKNQTPFAVRTKTMVVEAREAQGADFVVDSSLHTLEGTVEAAPSEEELNSEEEISVHAGESLEASSKGISKIKKFDIEDFKQHLEKPPGTPDPSEDEPPASAQPDLRPAFHVLAFEVGVLQSNLGGGPATYSPFLAWEPNLRLFDVGYISFAVRGHMSFAGSFTEFNALLSASLFDFVFAEAGGGTQYGAGTNPSSDMRVFRLGITLNRRGLLRRIFVGDAELFPQTPSGSQSSFQNYQFGLGFQL